MADAGSRSRASRPIFTFAAWFSLIVPLVAAGWAEYIVSLPPQGDQPNHHLTKADCVGLAVVFAVSFVAGCVSLGGIRSNGVWVTLPPAVLGILLNAALGVIAVIFVLLSGLHGA